MPRKNRELNWEHPNLPEYHTHADIARALHDANIFSMDVKEWVQGAVDRLIEELELRGYQIISDDALGDIRHNEFQAGYESGQYTVRQGY